MRTFEIVSPAGQVVGEGVEFETAANGRPAVAVCSAGWFGAAYPVVYAKVQDIPMAIPGTTTRFVDGE